MALDRVLLHLRRGPRVVKRAVDPADVYFLEADGGDTLVRFRRARRLRDVPWLAAAAPLFEPFGFLAIHRSHAVNLRRVRELRPRDDGEDWEVKLEPPVGAPGDYLPAAAALSFSLSHRLTRVSVETPCSWA